MMIIQVWLITEYNAGLWWYFFFLLRKEERKHSELLEKIFFLLSNKDPRLHNTAIVLQMLGRLCWENEHNYIFIWKMAFFFVPVPDLWIESCKIVEMISLLPVKEANSYSPLPVSRTLPSRWGSCSYDPLASWFSSLRQQKPKLLFFFFLGCLSELS